MRLPKALAPLAERNFRMLWIGQWLVSSMGMPVGFAVTGPVADHIGVPTTLVAAAVIMAVPCALVVLPEGTIVLEGAG